MAYFNSRLVAVLIGLILALGYSSSHAQERYNAQEIEQMVAPIALYPDALLSQVLMAATYPLDVVQAARWRARQSRSLTDQQLSALLQDKPWDPSVKSVAAFPDVLVMMDDKIDWTGRLGDAFLDQQNEVMDAVQRLRLRAQQAGHLASGPQQHVVVSGSPPVIVIEPAQTEVIYVPVYNPLLVYGVWPYPNYRPYYWQPPSYVAGGSIFGFSAGLIVGQALWSSYDWGHRNVYINVNRYNSFNRTRITSSEWRHRTRYASADYRRSHAGYGNRQFNGQGRPDYDRHKATGNYNSQGRPTPSTEPGNRADRGDRADRADRADRGSRGDQRNRGDRSDKGNMLRNSRDQGTAAVPGNIRNPGRVSTPSRSSDPDSARAPERIRNPSAEAQGRPGRVRPDNGSRERNPTMERGRSQPVVSPWAERSRSEAVRPTVERAERQARPQFQRADRPDRTERQDRPQMQRSERPQRNAPSRGRSEEGQRSQR
ncbi:DUF3300 domain-containing protein [Alcaligenaceae bacterium]|nr:DUF3300 domain-containing protein [Alcaligenaceae bacterium]